MTVVFFALVGLAAGYLTGRVGGEAGKLAGWVTAALIVAVTIGNIVADVAAEPLWHKLLVMFLMAPLVAWTAARSAVGASGADEQTMV